MRKYNFYSEFLRNPVYKLCQFSPQSSAQWNNFCNILISFHWVILFAYKPVLFKILEKILNTKFCTKFYYSSTLIWTLTPLLDIAINILRAHIHCSFSWSRLFKGFQQNWRKCRLYLSDGYRRVWVVNLLSKYPSPWCRVLQAPILDHLLFIIYIVNIFKEVSSYFLSRYVLSNGETLTQFFLGKIKHLLISKNEKWKNAKFTIRNLF